MKEALIQAGWVVSHDPLSIRIGKIGIHVDLGLDNLLGAEKDQQKIAVEIKGFVNLSKITDFYAAFGREHPSLDMSRSTQQDIAGYAMPE